MTQFGYAQFDRPKKSTRIGALKSEKAPPKKVDTDTVPLIIRYESSIGNQKDQPLSKNFSILPDPIGSKGQTPKENPRNPSEIYTEKVNKKSHDGEVLERYRTDSFLGEFKTGSRIVKIACRDHEYPDGDLVRIWVNGTIAVNSIMLEENFKEVFLDLGDGINKVEIEALNQGTSGPNTAQFTVVDDSGNLITNNKWNLITGTKAKLILTKVEMLQK